MKTKRCLARNSVRLLASAVLMAAAGLASAGQSLDIPSKTWGISFGNSKRFSGLRFNYQDSQVKRINGVNVTLWQPRKDDADAVIHGLSLGTIPGGGYLRGIQVGIFGVAAEKDIKGITLGGLGAGCGGDVVGLNLGGLGIGAGEDIKGITIGGLGAGAGGSMVGINIGGIGVGAGKDLVGINIGGVGAGTGENMRGLNIAGVGVGAGQVVAGINIGGIGVGAGERLTGLTLSGIAAGAPEVRGVTVGGLAVGGKDLMGIQMAGGFIKIAPGGRLTGFAASSFNYVRGAQIGLSVGIVNYAWSVKGLQVGLVNIVRDNPRGLKVLPVFNTSF